MLPRERWLVVFFSMFASGAAAQTFDNSGNGMLRGDYFVRQVLLSDISAQGVIGRARSILGTATFDGSGNYAFSGQFADTQLAQPQSYSVSGKYSLAPNGLFQMQNPIDTTDTDYGGVGAAGPSALVASATEGSYHDILVAIPAGSSFSTSNLAGAYSAGFVDFTGGSSAKARDGYFSFNSNGQGSLGNLPINGAAADSGNIPATQTASNVTYTIGANGSGTINFGSSAGLLNGSKNLYLSQDGNVFIGGSPGGFDLLVGTKAITPPALTSNVIGTYFLGAVEENASQLPKGPALIDSFYGSTNANGQGTSVSGVRFDAVGQKPYDSTFDSNYSVARDGTYQTDFFRYTWGAAGQVFLSVGLQGEYSLTVGLQTPGYSGPGVFLNPIGIVNSANFAPITNSIAPGEFVTLYGTNLSSATMQAPGLPLPVTLGGVQATVNGRPAPLLFVSQTQISLIVPYATSESFATFQVTNNLTPSNKVTVYRRATAPGVYTLTQNGVGSAAILHSDYTPVTLDNPANIGDTLQVFVTGLGAVSPPLPDGAAAPSSPLSQVVASVQVFIDDQPAQVAFKGLAPGFAGLYQINCVVPEGVSAGQVYLDISTPDGYTSEAKLYLQ